MPVDPNNKPWLSVIKTILISAFLYLRVELTYAVRGGGPFDINVAFPGPSYKRIYNIIDDHLIDYPERTSVEDNMDRALEWLESKAAIENWIYSRCYKGAARQLKKLELLKSGPRCDGRDLTIIKHNNYATRYQAHKVRVDTSRPLVKIVHYYLQHHAQYCLPLYRAKFLTLSKRMQQLAYKRVRDLSIGYMNGRVIFMTEQARDIRWTLCEINVMKRNLELLSSLNSAQLIHVAQAPTVEMIYDALKTMTNGEPEAEYLGQMRDEDGIVPRSKYKLLFERYLKEPCVYYIDKVGKDLMRPALYEASMLEGPTKQDLIDNVEYYLGQVGYQLCKFILNGRVSDLTKFEPFIWPDLEEHETTGVNDQANRSRS